MKQGKAQSNKKEIIIIGGGFAGMNLVKLLAKSEDYSVTLVDKNNYNFFPPLIYQIATGLLEIPSISFPFRKLLKDYKNVRFFMGELKEIVSSENKVILSTGELHYDYVVFATGVESNFFGIENIRKRAIPMKTLEDALNMRNIILQKVEKAARTTDEAERKKLLTFVVAGGGPTGVEISGMLAELKRSVFPKEYPEFANLKLENNVYLVDGANTLLAPMSVKSQKYTYDSLSKLGVNIILNAQVADFDGKTVYFKDGKIIETYNLIWAAGVTGKTISGIADTSFGRGKRLLVDQYNKVKDYENIYAIGDISLVTNDPAYPNGHPQMAQIAIQQGKNLAGNLKAMITKKTLSRFKYKDKGSMAIIGRNKAVADIPRKTHFSGFVAWLLWLFVHIMSLINYRNRLRTLYNWSVAYFTKDPSLRFIIRPAIVNENISRTTIEET